MPRCGATRNQFRGANREQAALTTQPPPLVGSGGSALASGKSEHARLDSNQRLLPPEGSALSTELRAPGRLAVYPRRRRRHGAIAARTGVTHPSPMLMTGPSPNQQAALPAKGGAGAQNVV